MTTEALLKERAEAEKKLAEVNAEIAREEALRVLYPDIQRHVGRWNKIGYCSASVNAQCTKYETRYNCGCCGDSPLELWPYIETPHGRVYSYPTAIFIGEKDWFAGGTVSRAGWRERLKGYGLSDALIEDVSCMFRDERQKALETVEQRYADGAATDEPEPLL